MGRMRILFDAVLFDLDGTLVATDRFWVDSARVGTLRAFAELGIERELPTAAEWMSIVGLPLVQGLEQLFPDLTPEQRALILKYCLEEEAKALRAGQAAFLPGVAETLAELRNRALRLGIASNCPASYLDTMMRELGLTRWIEAARCLDSPGTKSKTLMVADLLATFATRSAVMVGDRLGDRDAAWQNGLPHVHLTRGFAGPDEIVVCEARIEGLFELPGLLERRTRWIQNALVQLGLVPSSSSANLSLRSLGITGHSGAGKSLFARDVARLLVDAGRGATVVSFDEFLRPSAAAADLSSTAFVPRERPLEHVEQAFDLERLERELLAPHARGQDVVLHTPHGDVRVAGADLLVLEGLFLQHPRLRARLDRLVALDVSDSLALRRIGGRDLAAESVSRARRAYLPMQRGFDEHLPTRQHADLVLDAENTLGPAEG